MKRLGGKPNTLKHTSFMFHHATTLALEREFPTDEAIPSLLALQVLSEESHRALAGVNVLVPISSTMARWETILASIGTQLGECYVAMPGILQESSKSPFTILQVVSNMN